VNRFLPETDPANYAETETVNRFLPETDPANYAETETGNEFLPETNPETYASMNGLLAETAQTTSAQTGNVINVYLDPNLSQLNKIYSWTDLELGEQQLVSRTYIKSPADFYVQTYEQHLNAVKIGQWIIDIPAVSRVVIERPKVGQMCIAPYMMTYFRAEIVSINEKRARMFFIDFGNSSIVSRKCLYQIPSEFLEFPRQVAHCRWDMALARDMSEIEIKTIFEQDNLPIKPTHKIADGDYIVSIGELRPVSQLVVHSIIDPDEPLKNKVSKKGFAYFT